MKRKFILIILAYIFLLNISALALPRIVFNYDYSFFRGDESKVYVELYYSFAQSSLKFVKENAGYKGTGLMIIDVNDNTTGRPIILKEYRIPLIIKDTAGYNWSNNLVGQLNMLLTPGIYSMKIFAADFNDTTNNETFYDTMKVEMIPSDVVSSSSLQLSSNITKSGNTESIFYKNTLEVIPNPALFFGNNISQVFYYIEYYNLNINNLTDEYYVLVTMNDVKTGNELRSETYKYKLTGESKVVYGSFDIKDIPTASYKIIASLIDSKQDKKTENSKQFWVYNFQGTDVSSGDDFSTSEYVKYTDKMIEDEFEKSKYLMTDNLIDEIEKFSAENKKRAMYQFWKKLDPSPMTPKNENKIDYFKRVDYANKNFRNDFQDGWKTDRGRVYILYGPYDEIDRNPSLPDKRAYEIWSYNNIEGGVVFVFMDLSNNMGNYTLVHSTARNELRDDNWRNRLDVR